MLARPVGLPRPQRVLDLHRAQRARLSGEQFDDSLPSAAALEARPSQHHLDVVAPDRSVCHSRRGCHIRDSYPPRARIGFLVLLAVVTAESTQAVGALLLLGLIAAPGGAARVLTARPYRGVALSGAIAVGSMWGGLALSYAIGALPASTAVIGLAAGAYAAASLWSRLSGTRRAVAESRMRAGVNDSGGADG